MARDNINDRPRALSFQEAMIDLVTLAAPLLKQELQEAWNNAHQPAQTVAYQSCSFACKPDPASDIYNT